MADNVDPYDLSGASVRTDDWPAQATDAIVKAVGTAHDKITGPITTAARAVAYGLLVAILGTTVLVLGVIMLLRFLDAYLPDAVFGEEHMWAAHLVVGLVLTLFGLFFLVKARRTPADAD
jgi:glycerol uptake facilitator-like aquaporin